MRKLAVVLLAGAALHGCAGSSLLFSVTATPEGGAIGEVVIKGDHFEPQKVKIVLDALGSLPRAMTVPNLEINIREDAGHFGATWNGLGCVGHYHGCICPNPIICILPGWLTPDTVRHEVAHAYQGYLDRRTDFTECWLTIAGDAYDRKSNGGCKNGLLTNYAHGDEKEDVAVWVEECYKYLEQHSTPWSSERAILKGDCRYRLKLALLFRYGFFSKENYEKLKPLFE